MPWAFAGSKAMVVGYHGACKNRGCFNHIQAAALFDSFRRELQRHRQLPFLEAVAAACALVATADGEVSFYERARLDVVVESLSELKLFDPHEVVNAIDALGE